MIHQIITDLFTILFLCVVSGLACHVARIPPMVGFLVSGVIAGPSALGLIHSPHEVEILAETGVVLLLFVIGMEFSVTKLLRIKRAALLGGGSQVVLTISLTGAILFFIGVSPGPAIFWGFLMALSSTAVVLKHLQSRGDIVTPYGQVSLGVLIFQDIAVVPMMLLLPILAGQAENPAFALATAVGRAMLLIAAGFLAARFLVPKLLHKAAETRSREIFLLAVLLVCGGIVALSDKLGLSIALGAFLAGLIISETEFSYQAFAHVEPFRDVFTSFFFVSIGMLLDVRVLYSQPLLILGATGGVILLKAASTAIATRILMYPASVAVRTSASLSQVGEFSLVLAGQGAVLGLLTSGQSNLFLAMAIITMGLTPLLNTFGNHYASAWDKRRNGNIAPGSQVKGDTTGGIENHVVILGFGPVGRGVARAAKENAIPYRILEMNPETVRIEKKNGEPIVFGDASQDAVLEHLGVHQARAAVVSISDPEATARSVALLKRLNPALFVISRARFESEAEFLKRAGSQVVVTDENESSVRIFTSVLSHYLVPRNKIEEAVIGFREQRLSAGESQRENLDAGISLPEHEIVCLKIGTTSPVAGKTLQDSGIRTRTGATILAIRREGTFRPNPSPQEILKAEDEIVTFATPREIEAIERYLNPDEEPKR